MEYVIQVLSLLSVMLGLYVGWKVYRGYQYNQAVRRADVRIQQEAERQHQQEIKEQQLAYDTRKAILEFHRVKTQGLQFAIWRDRQYTVNPDGTLIVAHPTRPQTQVTVEEVEPQKQIEAPAPLLPGPCDLADILDGWRPTPQSILLALAPGGQYVTVPLKALCHVALAGATGGGKSVLMRLLLAQLLYVKANVILADPHFAPVDPESGEDWRPIAERLYMPPAVAYSAIRDVLRWLATDELPKRLERRRQGVHPGVPYFLAMDELPAIVKHVPEAPEYMADLLREGRKVGLFLVSAAQDWLVKTVGGSGAVRDCFRTAFYVGGDAQSARVLLDVRGRVDDGGLGKGVVMMRSSATPQAALSRIPYASNDALYDLLSLPSPRISEESDAVIVDEVTLEKETLTNVQTSPRSPINQPVEQTEPTSDGRPKRHLFSDVEISEFVTGYRASGSIDKVLNAMGKGTVYRDTARRIIEVYGLRREEA